MKTPNSHTLKNAYDLNLQTPPRSAKFDTFFLLVFMASTKIKIITTSIFKEDSFELIFIGEKSINYGNCSKIGRRSSKEE